MGTDIPTQEKAEIMVLCGHLIGPEQHGGPRRNRSVSHFPDYRVVGRAAESGSYLMLLMENRGKRKTS